MTITIKDVLKILREPLDVHTATSLSQPQPNRVDALKFGSLDTVVTGIVVSFMATVQVIEQAISLGANLIITHEGTFYSHTDMFERSLIDNPIYEAKKKLIDESGIAIYRCHDDIHAFKPDGIMEGLLRALGWQSHVMEHLAAASIVALPQSKTGLEIVDHVKWQLGIQAIRSAGDLSQICHRIGVLVGYRGGGPVAIPILEQYKLDLLIYGEGPEWETPEYVRDANDLGQHKALLVLGHAESEQPGMRLLAEALVHSLPDIPISFIAVEPIFQIR
jgi:putative NIF3 family GTP cyclohydrolase 1 type 2